ncbi:MAG: FIG097052: Sugar transporter [uncultured Campylobacterales bacterium]|uniref:FIG097052: Sugar transporter n=1 Tax=uncultured Campylobacterales bacterium TaxID=352960 RepID=A0A6S6T8Z9_9BACT|nr:MAG: FIG097052: Sugar transporter [uncultured Campylobacterales bacterium]
MKNIFLYGTLAFPIAIMGLPLYIYLPNFYSTTISVGLVGLVLFVARIIDMALDPFTGRLSDLLPNRMILIFIGCFCLLFGFFGLVNPAENHEVAWLFIFSIFTYTGWSILNISYFALGSDLGKSYQENNYFAFSREVFTIFGVIFALLVPYIYSVSQNSEESLQLYLNYIFIVLPIVFILFWLCLKEPKRKTKIIPFASSLKAFFISFKESKYLFIGFILNSTANALPATLFLFFVDLVLQTPEKSGLLLIVYFASGVLALPIWLFLSSKISKLKVWIISMVLACITFAFVPFVGSGDFILFLIICVITGMSLGADMALPSSIQADISQDISRNENELSGVLFGIWAMITKLSLALGVGISFIALELCNFDTVNPEPNSLGILIFLYSVLPIILKISAILFLRKFK